MRLNGPSRSCGSLSEEWLDLGGWLPSYDGFRFRQGGVLPRMPTSRCQILSIALVICDLCLMWLAENTELWYLKNADDLSS